MFTGIIEESGRIAAVDRCDGGIRISIAASLVTCDAEIGDSISVNGVCLTVVELGADTFAADISPETLDRTTLGVLTPGSKVNLERAVTPSTRLGGHIVQGHVDGRGTFLATFNDGEFRTIRIGFPSEMRRYFVFKGSVTVEGISLTIAALEDEHFDIALIPKTWEMTNLPTLKPGDQVNLEVDVIAKYVENIMRYGDK